MVSEYEWTGQIQRQSPLPLYEQLKRLLEEDVIKRNGLRPGDLLPSEAQICERYAVSRTVVRQAIGELVNQGRLYRMQGKGTFVAVPKFREQFLHTGIGLFEDLTSSGHDVKSKVLTCNLVAAPQDIATGLGVPSNAHVVQLDRLRYVNGEIVTFTVSYLPENGHTLGLLERLRDAPLETESLYGFLETSYGIRIGSGTRSIEAVAASNDMATLLDVSPGNPLLYIESIVRDASDRPVEHFLAWHRGDRARFEVQFPF